MTSKRAMDRDRLRQILDSFGGEPSRWPAAERSAAESLLARSPELAGDRKSALALDALLGRAPEAAVTPALRTRIYEQAVHALGAPAAPARARRAVLSRLVDGLASLFRLPDASGGLMAYARPISAALLAVCIGLGAGVSLPGASGTSPPSEVDYLSAMWAAPVLAQDVGDLNVQ